MPNLNYTANGFPSSLEVLFRVSGPMNVRWPGLIWAAVTVGRKNCDEVVQHGYHSTLEILYRFAILMANLKDSAQGEFTKTDAYKSLDPSEKSAISYFLGLSFAKWAAQELLETPWLIHLDRFSDAPIVLKGNRRPDLIGMNKSGKWGVFEAKGRTNKIKPELILKAKQQTQMLRTIDSCDPWVRVASIVHFSDDRLELHLEDPEPNESHPDAVDLDIPDIEDRFLKYYYEPFLSLIENNHPSSERIADRTIEIVNLVDVDLAVGLDSQVQDVLTRTSEYPSFKNHLLDLYEGIFRAHSENNDTASFLGLDGVFIRLGESWSSKYTS